MCNPVYRRQSDTLELELRTTTNGPKWILYFASSERAARALNHQSISPAQTPPLSMVNKDMNNKFSSQILQIWLGVYDG